MDGLNYDSFEVVDEEEVEVQEIPPPPPPVAPKPKVVEKKPEVKKEEPAPVPDIDKITWGPIVAMADTFVNGNKYIPPVKLKAGKELRTNKKHVAPTIVHVTIMHGQITKVLEDLYMKHIITKEQQRSFLARAESMINNSKMVGIGNAELTNDLSNLKAELDSLRKNKPLPDAVFYKKPAKKTKTA